ncbi:hypothetical protein CEXT_396511 [Caerostris extrusa]|uniref:Uncharacterized protein n=1 Tax=Caerostris extrusa TaxID=172846 RepID=A0AAV4SC16_CAEEX|nr:hypothetical protein CEXT_396511 [Caerostris extrusa]
MRPRNIFSAHERSPIEPGFSHRIGWLEFGGTQRKDFVGQIEVEAQHLFTSCCCDWEESVVNPGVKFCTIVPFDLIVPEEFTGIGCQLILLFLFSLKT